jgi:hypothetical protein
LEEVNQELEQGLAEYQQEQRQFATLIFMMPGQQIDHGLRQVVLQHIHADEAALREKAALEVRLILAQTER